MDRILFYGHTRPYGFLSNFYYSPILFTEDLRVLSIDELYRLNLWCARNVECAFQAMKFTNEKEWFRTILSCESPGRAKQLGNSRRYPIRADWEDVKVGFMYSLLFLKFTQNENLKEKLLETGDVELVEDSPSDYFWGCGKDGSGKNMLGKLLMKVRTELCADIAE